MLLGRGLLDLGHRAVLHVGGRGAVFLRHRLAVGRPRAVVPVRHRDLGHLAGGCVPNGGGDVAIFTRLDRGGIHFGTTTADRLFNVALELVITWINRILFLKLLEAQLLSYHKGNKAYAFEDRTGILVGENDIAKFHGRVFDLERHARRLVG